MSCKYSQAGRITRDSSNTQVRKQEKRRGGEREKISKENREERGRAEKRREEKGDNVKRREERKR